jgi:hypothetical protein
LYEIAIINPRTLKTRRKAKKAGVAKVAKKRRRKMSAKQAKFFGPKRKRRVRRARAKVSAPRKRRRAARSTAKRVASSAGYTQGPGRIRRRKLNPRRRVARRSNPRFNLSGITSQLVPAAYGAGGALALDLALGYIPLPAMLKTGYARHATRIVGALGIGWLAGKFLRGKSQAIGAGALTVAMYGLFKDVALQFAPAAISAKLGEYEEITVQGYDDPAEGTAGVGAYLSGDGYSDEDLGGVGAYMQSMGGADY